jgi:putative DNA primase/helicase
MLRQVQRFMVNHGEAKFTYWHRAADDHAGKTLLRVGVRCMLDQDGNEVRTNSRHSAEFGDRMPPALGEGVAFNYYILAEPFQSEVCQGFDHKAVARVLQEHGCLIVKEPGRYSIKTKLPGIGPARCYCITPALFGLDL